MKGFLRDSSAIAYHVNNMERFGYIKVFIRVTNCNCTKLCWCTAKFYALVQRVECHRAFKITELCMEIPWMLSCEITDSIDVISVECVKSVCFKIPVDSQMFLSLPPNSYELE